MGWKLPMLNLLYGWRVKSVFYAQTDWAVTVGAYVACHFGFKDEVEPVRMVQ